MTSAILQGGISRSQPLGSATNIVRLLREAEDGRGLESEFVEALEEALVVSRLDDVGEERRLRKGKTRKRGLQCHQEGTSPYLGMAM